MLVFTSAPGGASGTAGQVVLSAGGGFFVVLVVLGSPPPGGFRPTSHVLKIKNSVPVQSCHQLRTNRFSERYGLIASAILLFAVDPRFGTNDYLQETGSNSRYQLCRGCSRLGGFRQPVLPTERQWRSVGVEGR